MIETFEANLKGRDYVCGDVHGAYSRIEQFLEFVRSRYVLSINIVLNNVDSLHGYTDIHVLMLLSITHAKLFAGLQHIMLI